MDRDGAVVVGQIHTQPKKTEEKTQEDVAKEIKNWIQLDNEDIDLKLLPNAVSHIESELGRQLSSLETTSLEWQYVKIVLEMWHSEAFRKMFDDLENPATDISIELSTLLCELNSVNSFQEIDTKLEVDGSRLRIWCDGGCRYLQMIVKQEELFKDTPRFTILVPCYFNHFKIFCINELFSRCWNYVVNEKTNGEKYRNFLSALNNFLANIMEYKEFQDIMEKAVSENVLAMDSIISWPKCINMICEHFPTDCTEESLIQRFKQAAASISDDDWTREFTSLVKEIFKKNLLPKTDVQVKNEDGREIISIQGNVVFLSKIMEKMIELKSNIVQEIQIVGLVSVHVDCDLEKDIWHGINVGVITDKIIVDCEVLWNVSGQHITHQGAEEPRQPGESGGNVHLVCNEMINANQWTIISDGGDGSAAHKWTRDEFKNAFPSMSLFGRTGDQNKETIATKLRNLLPGERVSQLLTQPNFMIDEFMEDVQQFMVSFYKTEKERHTLIFFQGRGVGQGGYSGTVTLEILNRSPSVQPSLPFIGFQNRLPYATRLSDVYQASGSDGKTGKPAGDIGFIHNVNSDNCDWNVEGNYFGFEIDTRLELNLSKNPSKGKNSCARQVQNVENPLKRYTSIEIKEGVPETKRLVEAVKKKAILRQNLFQHLSQINQRKEMFQTLQAIFYSPLQSHPISRDEVLAKQVQSIEIQLRQLSLRSQQFQMDNKQAKMVKPACLEQLKLYDLDSAPLLANQQQAVTGCEDVASTLNSAIDPGLNKARPKPKERNVKSILRGMRLQISEESDGKDTQLNRHLEFIESSVCGSKEMDLNAVAASFGSRTERFDRNVKLIKNEWSKDGLSLSSDLQLARFLYVYNHAVKEQLGFSLCDAQRVAIMTLLLRCDPDVYNSLVQVSTGEGKSLIVAGVAIAFALSAKKESKSFCHIDVITSNSVLALRDSTLSSDKGGLKDIYEFFNVSVANNCSHSIEERTKAYDSAVVYGELANFQRDYLLDKFYGSDIRGNRRFEHVIIDEVDCMLLDRGNNTLYLSHDIPGMETLESLYVFIWEKMCNSTDEENNSKDRLKEWIESGVLFDLYGVTAKNDLKLVHEPLDDFEKNALWNHLIKKKVIDENARLLIADANQITEEKINYKPKNAQLKETNLNAKLVFYLRNLANRQRRIRIPAHLLGFVDRNLKTWINNAFHALDLRRDENYVIDQDRTDTSPDLNPQVIIIDPDTGTDQTLSQWDGALHQFLQLKEGCKLTLQSLKAVFISNATYIRKYERMLGVSGTLGSEQEQHFLSNIYECRCVRLPTAFPKVFTLRPTKVFFSEAQWLQEIIRETLDVLNVPKENQRELNDVDVKTRSIVIFCRTIREVKKLYQKLKLYLPIDRIHRYTRDYEKFAFESGQLDIGHAILATNLAGRGTDIKISNNLRTNGGLHICLTYLPENERIKEQAMGRAARKGDPGSGILILYDNRSGHTSNKDKELDAEELLKEMEVKRNEQESQRISRLKEDFENNERQEDLFKNFIETFAEKKIQAKLEESSRKKDIYQHHHVVMQAIRDSALDKWALFLDANDSHCSVDFQMEGPNLENFDDIINWIMPVRSIAVAKHLAIREKPYLSMAIDILERIVNSDSSFFYPAAHYYQTFIFLKEFLEEKDELFRRLRVAETVINDHIDMQLSFNSIINKSMSNSVKIPSFCVVDAYKEQKENNVKIMEYFLGSLRSLVGNYCSVAELREASKAFPKKTGFLKKTLSKIKKFFDNDKNKTRKVQGGQKIRMQNMDKHFKSLIESRWIACELNDPDTIPNSSIYSNQEEVDNESCSNRSALIQLIADDYGVGVSLEKTLISIFNEANSEEEIEKELKKENLIPYSRKMFWKKLVDTEVLKIPKVGVEMECVIMPDTQCNGIPKLDRNEAIALNFGIDTYDSKLNCLNVLYNPIYDNEEQFKEKKKIMFPKTYVKRILSVTEYELGKQNFEFNKIARLDLNKLKTIDLREFGCLRDDDFYRANIIPAEREGLKNELLEKKVIDDQGFLLADYDVTKGFDYPQCPAYSEAVMHLIGRKFVVEIVRRQWLKIQDTTSKSGPDYLKAINLLPLKPYRDMLGDLMAAHVISGARITEEDETKLKKKISKLKNADDQERKILLEFFENHQSVYSRPVTPEFFLDPLERILRIGSGSSNIFNELIAFHLMELDSVIDVKNREWTWKMICLTSLLALIIIAGGAASVGAGAFLTYSQILSFGFCKDLLFMGGFSDIAYAVTTILLRKDFTWADYGRQRIRSAMGKVDPIETIKTIYKLSDDSKQDIQPRIKTNSDHKWMQHGRKKEAESGMANTQCKSSTCMETDDEGQTGEMC